VPTPAPVVSSCVPNSGSRKQRLTVRIYGTDFQDGATVSFGSGIAVRRVSYVSPEQLNASIRIGPRAALAQRDVIVTNPDGQSGTGTGCFSVN